MCSSPNEFVRSFKCRRLRKAQTFPPVAPKPPLPPRVGQPQSWAWPGVPRREAWGGPARGALVGGPRMPSLEAPAYLPFRKELTLRSWIPLPQALAFPWVLPHWSMKLAWT